MSTMRWTYQSQTRGIALVDSQYFKKGESIPIQVWELYTDSRGNPEGQTSMVYYYGKAPMPEEAPKPKPSMIRPKGLRLYEGKDFEIIGKPEAMPSKPQKELLSNNKTVMWLGLIVVGYFAYKYYNKK